ncbi:MAG TPA: ribosome biogenesis/translation initiation ATPase RLI [Candidatus Nanoarchaeia archaeon]|nr:ribosome biogenesis/translation initiation ATPase RLI [Candidatus Nanoarchaeia archaeon]
MVKRIAVIEEEKCFPDKCGNFLCIRYCPVNREGSECIYKGKGQADRPKAKIHTELCIGCMICPKKCPFGAIHIVNLPDALEQDPIHQYGENGFHLYGLPTPIFGKVVGILGRNGIGKSSAVKILAGLLQPNFGGSEELDTPAYRKKLLAYFKGNEAQIFFTKQLAGDIVVAYKPQAVDQLAQQFSGTVDDLLRAVDQQGKRSQVSADLDLIPFLETKLADLSGGELQRVAIAATVLKQANVYFFDEPTSYLDIKQRIKVAQFLKGLATPSTAVVVIEHDLVVLDYLADLVQIMYGDPGAYGIVSQLKAARAGMNAYLSGLLREENMQIRDHPIKFEVRAPENLKSREVLTDWHGIEKVQGKFTLEANEGEIRRRAVIGVLGENGIGKTTFVKILAGVEKSSGTLSKTVPVSYKPQYLSSISDKTVEEVLQHAINTYEAQLILPLEIRPLLLKKLSMLSGGELQRVAICHALSQKADLYLLDEPSAYLDVEQRLICARVIRNFMDERGASAIIVDHDLLFLDEISNQLMVFDGLPARHGAAHGPFAMEEGMNRFLSLLSITLRRDQESHRPRINKLGSQMDREQRSQNKWYYS